MRCCDLQDNHSLVKLYDHKLETEDVQGMQELSLVGLTTSSFQNQKMLAIQISEKCNSCRYLHMSTVLLTKSHPDFFYGVPQGLGFEEGFTIMFDQFSLNETKTVYVGL